MSDTKESKLLLIELHKKALALMQNYGYPHPDYLALLEQIKQLNS